jgi:hypothetical protein
MNPSAQDWINKLLSSYRDGTPGSQFSSETEFYNALRKSGFIYGLSNEHITKLTLGSLKLNTEELSKVNLFYSLLYIYYKNNQNGTKEGAIESILTFYNTLEKGKSSFLINLSFSKSDPRKLEQLLSRRLQESNSIVKTNVISLLTYALLFIDVIVYERWLSAPQEIKAFATDIETIAISCSFLALKSKQKKNKYDKLLIELFETSATYIIDTDHFETETTENKFKEYNITTRNYLLDVACIAVWEDTKMEMSEYLFLENITSKLGFNSESLSKSIFELQEFSQGIKQKIKLFEYSSPIKQFYKQSIITVRRLILRNSDRLLKELSESGELLLLLGSSAHSDLSIEEKGKVKDQLLDVCKSIPSLTIFLLPGGTLLIPILVKFIPKLLPSAFDENRVSKKE